MIENFDSIYDDFWLYVWKNISNIIVYLKVTVELIKYNNK